MEIVRTRHLARSASKLCYVVKSNKTQRHNKVNIRSQYLELVVFISLNNVERAFGLCDSNLVGWLLSNNWLSLFIFLCLFSFSRSPASSLSKSQLTSDGTCLSFSRILRPHAHRFPFTIIPPFGSNSIFLFLTNQFHWHSYYHYFIIMSSKVQPVAAPKSENWNVIL